MDSRDPAKSSGGHQWYTAGEVRQSNTNYSKSEDEPSQTQQEKYAHPISQAFDEEGKKIQNQ